MPAMALDEISVDEARTAAERAAERLASDPRVRLVFLFGSAADPARRGARDVDLAISCSPPIGVAELMRLRADLIGITGAPIDLVSLDEAGVVLTWEIAETGRCLFARDVDGEVEFVTRARARYWDFKPFLEEQWRLTNERVEERRRGPQT